MAGGNATRARKHRTTRLRSRAGLFEVVTEAGSVLLRLSGLRGKMDLHDVCVASTNSSPVAGRTRHESLFGDEAAKYQVHGEKASTLIVHAYGGGAPMTGPFLQETGHLPDPVRSLPFGANGCGSGRCSFVPTQQSS